MISLSLALSQVEVQGTGGNGVGGESRKPCGGPEGLRGGLGLGGLGVLGRAGGAGSFEELSDDRMDGKGHSQG